MSINDYFVILKREGKRLMKIFSLIILLMLISVIPILAQNFEVVVIDTVAEDSPGEEIVLGGHIVNLTSKALTIELTRATNELPPNWNSALCLGLCAAPHVNTLTDEIAAYDSAEFSIHFRTDSIPGVGKALLVFKELYGTDSTSHLFTAKTSTIGISSINDLEAYSFRLSGNYPNPFNNSTIIRFQTKKPIVSANLQIFSITGQLVFKKTYTNLPVGENQISYPGLDLHGSVLPTGVYIYRLFLSNKKGKKFTGFGKFSLIK